VHSRYLPAGGNHGFAARGFPYPTPAAIPDFCGQYPTASLVSLSTSARIRCFVRLATRPNNWLIDDDNAVVALWRRSILSIGGHAQLIELLANALERKRQRIRPIKRKQPTTELSTFLTAYLRMMENPRRRFGSSRIGG
jgi:hypothetical protein